MQLPGKSIFLRAKLFVFDHYQAFVLSILVGVIGVAPQLIFIQKLGDDYRGLHMMAVDDEDYYLSRIQEIIDGHVLTGNVPLYEYKDNYPLYPPTSDLLLAFLTKFITFSPVNTLIAVKFFLPAAFFFLIYMFIFRLLDKPEQRTKNSAITSGLLILLGYNLLNLRELINFFFGISAPQSFLIWTRPENPIHGGLILFGLLLILWSLRRGISKKKIFAGSLLFALGVSSYFFVWSLSLSIMATLAVIYTFQKRFYLVKSIGAIFGLGIIFAGPYFYLAFKAAQSPSYTDAAIRLGLGYSHNPILNKILIASTIVFLILSLKVFLNQSGGKRNVEDWWLFCAALLFSGLAVFNQQILSGVTIWPPHFVQYTTPLSVVVLVIIGFKKIQPAFPKLWLLLLTLVAVSALGYGILRQYSAYQHNFYRYRELQKVKIVLDWLRQNTSKDSVILVNEKNELLTRLIPAFTHNNIYSGTYSILFATPIERILHNYMVELRLQGIKPDELERYTASNSLLHKTYFGGLEDWKNLRVTKAYLKNKDLVSRAYPDFYRADLYRELKKYRLDYILQEGLLDENLRQLLPQAELVKEINGHYLYRLP